MLGRDVSFISRRSSRAVQQELAADSLSACKQANFGQKCIEVRFDGPEACEACLRQHRLEQAG